MAKSDGGKLIAEYLSTDHKPTLASEEERVEKAKGFVSDDGRINGTIACARSIGDLQYKEAEGLDHFEQIVSCEPDIKVVPRAGVKYVILGCDGIWDCKTNQEAVDHLHTGLSKGRDMEEVMSEFVEGLLPAKAKGPGIDNMSLIVVELK